MTQPTLAELDRIKEADRYTEAALEFVWAFTEWWEATVEDEWGRMDVDTDHGKAMERAYERWRNLR